MWIEVCDICGKEIDREVDGITLKFSKKDRLYVFSRHGKFRLCSNCINNIDKYCREKRGDN